MRMTLRPSWANASASSASNTASPVAAPGEAGRPFATRVTDARGSTIDRKSTRLNSSHLVISYAVFCLKKKNKVFCRHIVQARITVERDDYPSGLVLGHEQ